MLCWGVGKGGSIVGVSGAVVELRRSMGGGKDEMMAKSERRRRYRNVWLSRGFDQTGDGGGCCDDGGDGGCDSGCDGGYDGGGGRFDCGGSDVGVVGWWWCAMLCL